MFDGNKQKEHLGPLTLFISSFTQKNIENILAEHFILFLCYTWIGCVYALVLFALNYFFCSSEDCQFDVILMQLVRVMTLLCIVTLLFVSSM
jgi:hypothetical protein